MADPSEKELQFARDLILELLGAAMRDNIAEAPSGPDAEGIVFRETLGRVDFENRTIAGSNYDVGYVSEGCISLAALALKFGIFLAWQGVNLTHDGYFQRSDH